MRWYTEILEFIQRSAPAIRATRQINLALLVAAILSRRKLSLSALARELARSPLTKSRSHHQNKKRLFRFLSNQRFDPLRAQAAMITQLSESARLGGLTPIMIDWSDLGRGFNGLFAAVCFRKRGLPLLSWVSRPEELRRSQNRLEEMFIRILIAHLPSTIRPLILADRGFGRASLLQFLKRLSGSGGHPVDYIVRLRGDVIVQSDSFRGRLRQYSLRRRRYVLVRDARYSKDDAVRTNLVLYWGVGHIEPWYLATSLSDPKLAVKMYRRRMQPEQYFRDGKQRLDLDSATVMTSSRMRRLMVAVVLACCLLILAATRVSWRFIRQVSSWGKLGILHLGLEFYLSTPDPPLRYFCLTQPQSGYA